MGTSGKSVLKLSRATWAVEYPLNGAL